MKEYDRVELIVEKEKYAEDGAHASERGSDFAAKYIWDAIAKDISRKTSAESLS